jgi:Fic family protein
MRPPFEINPTILSLVAAVERLVGRHEGMWRPPAGPQLRRSSRVRTVQGSLAIEGNTLGEDQVTALLEGKRVAAPARDILEVRNALAAYERLPSWKPHLSKHLLQAHGVMMRGLITSAGRWRTRGVGIARGDEVAHVAPPPSRVPALMADLAKFLRDDSEIHSVIRAAVFHYELEFIHPFEEGNGRIGRLWHTLILGHWQAIFFHVPIESLIRERQSEYYRVLSECDQVGKSTSFIEFMLDLTRLALAEVVATLTAAVVTPEQRLDFAAGHFGPNEFARKEYLILFPSLSTASGSRDLAFGLAQKRLSRSGDKNQARYRFRD